jgi:transposase
MKKLNVVRLAADERDALEEYVRRGELTRLQRARAQILLMSDAGGCDEEIADELEIGTATVERVRRRFVERGVAGCVERKPSIRTSRQRKFDGDTEAKLVQIACSKPPAGRARWTMSLLSDRLVELKIFDSVSKSSVQRTLKKTRSNRGK